MADTAAMSNASLGVTRDFPNRPDVIAYWQSKGWVLVDPNVTQPPVFDPVLDAEIAGLLGNPSSATGLAGRAAFDAAEETAVRALRHAVGDGVADDTAALQAALTAAATRGVPLDLGAATYLASGTLLTTVPVRIVGTGATIKLKSGTIVNTDAAHATFVPILRAQGVAWLHISGVTFDGNRDGQTYPATSGLVGRGTKPWRHNASVEITPGADNATRSQRIVIERCQFINGYLNGLSTWQCTDVTVRDSLFQYNAWSGAVGAGVDGYLFQNNRGYRNGVSAAYPQTQQDGDRATIQIREYDKSQTATSEGLPTIGATNSQFNVGVQIIGNICIQDGVEGIFTRSCRSIRISGNRVVDPGYGRPSTASFYPGGIWFEWGQATITDNVVWCPTSNSGAGGMNPDGIVCYTFMGDGAEPIIAEGAYQSIVANNILYCGQEYPLASGTFADAANKKTNFYRGIRVNSNVDLSGNIIEGCTSYPIYVINDGNYQLSGPANVQIRDGYITNFTAESAIQFARYGSAAGGGRITCRGVRIDDGRSTLTGTTTRALIALNTNFDAQLAEFVDISGNSLDCTNAADSTLPYAAIQYRGLASSRGIRISDNTIRGSQRGIRIAAGASVQVNNNVFTDCSRCLDLIQTGNITVLSFCGNTASNQVTTVVDGTFNGFTIGQLVFVGNNIQGPGGTVFAAWTVGAAGITQAVLAPNILKLFNNVDLRRTVTGAAPTFNAWHQGEIVKRTDGTSPTAYLGVTVGGGSADWVPIN